VLDCVVLVASNFRSYGTCRVQFVLHLYFRYFVYCCTLVAVVSEFVHLRCCFLLPELPRLYTLFRTWWPCKWITCTVFLKRRRGGIRHPQNFKSIDFSLGLNGTSGRGSFRTYTILLKIIPSLTSCVQVWSCFLMI
jgi:hypothetical protein